MRIAGRLLLYILALGIALSTATVLAEGELSFYAVNVGKGDALLITDGQASVLVDTGYVWTIGKIRAAMEYLQVTSLDAVIITHTDKDHVGGLDWLADSQIDIEAWYASREYTGIKNESKHPAYKAAEKRGQAVRWIAAGDQISIGNMSFDVLAPREHSENENDNSLVIMLTSDAGRILLSGDMEYDEEALLLADTPDLTCDVLKVPNHADNDTASEKFLAACRPKLAVISTSSFEKPETPDPRILAILQQIGAKTFVTQEATGGILVTLSEGVPMAIGVELPQPIEGVRLQSVIPGDDVIALQNTADREIDISGWYLVSEKGNEFFVFPEGASLAAGHVMTVGTNTTEYATDQHWDDKKVIHASKADAIGLYDDNGNLIDTMTNGL